MRTARSSRASPRQRPETLRTREARERRGGEERSDIPGQLEFTSRGGSIEFLLKKKRERLAMIRQQPCFAAHEMLIVGWDGHILRCYEDARRDEPLGNLQTHTLGAIWEQSQPIRQALACGKRREAGRPCGGCDNLNHTRPGQSLATEPFWKTYPPATAIAESHFRR